MDIDNAALAEWLKNNLERLTPLQRRIETLSSLIVGQDSLEEPFVSIYLECIKL